MFSLWEINITTFIRITIEPVCYSLIMLSLDIVFSICL